MMSDVECLESTGSGIRKRERVIKRDKKSKSAHRRCGTCETPLNWSDKRCWQCNAVLANWVRQFKWAILGILGFGMFCGGIWAVSVFMMK